MKRSRRVRAPSIFCFSLTPKTHGDRCSASCQCFGDFRPNPSKSKLLTRISLMLRHILFTLAHFWASENHFLQLVYFFFISIFGLRHYTFLIICPQITFFIEFKYFHFSSCFSDFRFFRQCDGPLISYSKINENQ